MSLYVPFVCQPEENEELKSQIAKMTEKSSSLEEVSVVISCVTQYNLIFLMVSVQVFSILFRIGLNLVYDQGCVRLTLFRHRNIIQ